jgi:FKBP-type peptidyl-prolyl cis-trans isomerase
MSKGTKMTVYIPSTLAYGNRRASPIIGENSILVFDMEVVDVK